MLYKMLSSLSSERIETMFLLPKCAAAIYFSEQCDLKQLGRFASPNHNLYIGAHTGGPIICTHDDPPTLTRYTSTTCFCKLIKVSLAMFQYCGKPLIRDRANLWTSHINMIKLTQIVTLS